MLKLLFNEFTVIPAKIQELHIPVTTPAEYVIKLARTKANAVAKRAGADSVVIGADTIVVCDNEVFGKPSDAEEAQFMLVRLSGRIHSVFTGIALVKGKEIKTAAVETLVKFRRLKINDIQRYIATGEPMDKSGAYGIQGKGAVLVDSVIGDYMNVVGLPIGRLSELLKEFDIDIWQ